MIKYSGEMWEKNSKKTLLDILMKISNNDYIWSIFEFSGVGILPNDLSIPDFEDIVFNSKYGYQMKWKDLLTLSKTIDDINDFMVIGSTNKFISYDNIKSSNDVFVIVDIFDSTRWEICFKCEVKCIKNRI